MERGYTIKSQKMHINTGGAFIILLIAVLALTVFAVLSIRASYNELQMSKRMRNSVQIYYEADQKAGERCAEIYRAWEKTEPQAREEKEISFEVEVDYNRTLQISMYCDRKQCVITGWRLESSEYGSYEGESVDIWDGTVE